MVGRHVEKSIAHQQLTLVNQIGMACQPLVAGFIADLLNLSPDRLHCEAGIISWGA